jgi:uncharacterized protein (DUF2062 family)
MILKRRKAVSVWRRVRNFFWPEIGFQRAAKYMGHKVNRIKGSPHAIALGFAAGAFASFTPAVGFHFILAAIIAWVLGANILASAIGTSVGNPLTFPFIWISTHNLGSALLGVQGRNDISLTGPEGGLALMFAHPGMFFAELWAGLEPVFWPMFIGSIPTGVGLWCVVLFFAQAHGATLQGAPCKTARKAQCTEIKARRQAEAEARAATSSPVRPEQ